MFRIEQLHNRVKFFVLGVLLGSPLWIVAQTASNDAIESAESDRADKFTVLNELERQSYQEERFELIKEKLAYSPLTMEHQDLLAQALSKLHGGHPVSSCTEKSVHKGSLVEGLDEKQRSIAILDSGSVEIDQTRSAPLNILYSPFRQIPIVSWNFPTGKVLAETDSEITFRFDRDPKSTDDAEREDFELRNFITGILRRMDLVSDITIDKNNRTVLRNSEHLLRSFGKMFIYRVKKTERYTRF